MVGDQAVFGIRVSTAGGQSITGVQVTWESDKPAKLEVLPLPAGGTTEDSLSAQLSAVVRAYARDSSVTITATVDRPGFERDVLSRRVVVMERWLSLGAGKSHTCGIVYNHEAYCWGNGQKGALGNGQTTSDVPDKVLGLGDFEFESISAGEENTCGIIIQRLAYCWGSGSLGRLGNGSQADRFFPTEVSLGRATLLMRAGATTCAISTASEGFCWGNNALLQLGVPVSADTFDRCGSDECSLTPRGVRTASDAPFLFSSVDVGTSHVCGISKQPSSTDRAFCWGSGTQEPLTLARVYLLGDTVFSSRTPRAVAPPLGATVALAFRSISAGDKHACGITTAGVAYCWGWNGRGQLGTGLMTNEGNDGKPSLRFDNGWQHSFVRSEPQRERVLLGRKRLWSARGRLALQHRRPRTQAGSRKPHLRFSKCRVFPYLRDHHARSDVLLGSSNRRAVGNRGTPSNVHSQRLARALQSRPTPGGRASSAASSRFLASLH